MWRRAVLILFIASLAAGFTWHNHRPRPYPPEIIDDDALTMIDFAQLEPEVAAFLRDARNNQTVGHRISAFPGLWKHTCTTLEDPTTERFILYQFILPMTAEQRAESDMQISKQFGVVCWPMLGVRVDTKSSTIAQTAVSTQCL